jgi:H3 lysine-79-specific histone-lysine N-methyltransferase
MALVSLTKDALRSGRGADGREQTDFKDLGPTPTATLLYPAGASETYVPLLPSEPSPLRVLPLTLRLSFTLLVPRDIDEYDPLGDLLRVVRAVVSAFLPREYAVKHFGNLEELEFGSAAGAILSAAAQTSTPMGNGSQTPISSTSTSTPTPSSPRGSVPQLNDSSPSKDSPAPSASQDRSSEQDSILRSFTKARNRRDGPLFLRTLERYNVALSAARREGVVAQAAQAMEQRGLPDYVWETVGEQCYSRTVGPYVEELGKYQAFSDNVYVALLSLFALAPLALHGTCD